MRDGAGLAIEGQQLVVLAPNWLGDAVMALPAIADLRRAYPTTRIAVAARGAVVDLFRLVTTVDAVVPLQSDARWWRGGSRRADVATLRAAAFDGALLLPNSFHSAWLVWRAAVPMRAGYATDMRGPLLTHSVASRPRDVHQGEYYQALTRALGAPSGSTAPIIDISPSARSAARDLLADRGLPAHAGVVVLAPGAAYGSAKQWILAHVAELVSRLTSERDLRCVLVGTRGDRPAVEAIRATLTPGAAARVIDLTGETTLEMLAAVLARADVCVANDSGAMHLAAAVGTPLVAIFGPTREWATAPRPREGQRTEVITEDVWCRPCMLRECPIDHRCMTRITPDRVFRAVTAVADARPR